MTPRWLLVLGLLIAIPVAAHPNTVLLCNKLSTANALSASVLPNGLYSERYDTNGDGILDLETLSAITAVEIGATMADVTIVHRPFPIFYVEDTDFDGQPDRILVDKGEGGRCEDLALYEDLSKLRDRSATQKDGRS